MDVPASIIREVEQSDSDLVLNFYSYAAFRFGYDGMQPASQGQAAELMKDWRAMTPQEKDSPQRMQSLLERFKIETDRFAPYMDDFRYYSENMEQRRPDEWSKRGSWGFGQLARNQ
jgi:hypothetical protein